MKVAENFTGWDFELVWAMDEDYQEGAPSLRWQGLFSETTPGDDEDHITPPGDDTTEPGDDEEPGIPGDGDDPIADDGEEAPDGEDDDDAAEPGDDSGSEVVPVPKLGDQGIFWNVLLLILSSFVVLATVRQKGKVR